MSIARIRILAIAVALAGSGMAISLLQARASDWKVGDVFVAIGKGKYEVRSSTGALKETINTGTNKEVAGCWFDSQFNLYTADIYNTRVLRRNLASPAHTQSVFANTLLQAPDAAPDVAREGGVGAARGQAFRVDLVDGEIARLAEVRVEARCLEHARASAPPRPRAAPGAPCRPCRPRAARPVAG